jgi:predicted transcriptional regulator
MGTTKTEQFTAEQVEQAAWFKAIGNPARLAILQFLAKQSSCICGDIVDEIGLAQPTISAHLKELKQAGLIQGTISGKAICYCINQEAVARLQEALLGFLPPAQSSTCC